MKVYKTDHMIRGIRRTLTWLVYDVNELVNYKYPRWKFENRTFAGLSNAVLEGCVINRPLPKSKSRHYSDTYPYKHEPNNF